MEYVIQDAVLKEMCVCPPVSNLKTRHLHQINRHDCPAERFITRFSLQTYFVYQKTIYFQDFAWNLLLTQKAPACFSHTLIVWNAGKRRRWNNTIFWYGRIVYGADN